jgi:DNA-binding transcriptional regulator YiaG
MKNVIEGYGGLDYIRLTIKSKTIPHARLKELEKEMAKAIIQIKPLRGKEVKFLRKILGLSLGKLVVEMEGMVDQSTVSRWEQKGIDRLSPANESLMRSFFAYEFDVKLRATPEILIPRESEDLVEIKAA